MARKEDDPMALAQRCWQSPPGAHQHTGVLQRIRENERLIDPITPADGGKDGFVAYPAHIRRRRVWNGDDALRIESAVPENILLRVLRNGQDHIGITQHQPRTDIQINRHRH